MGVQEPGGVDAATGGALGHGGGEGDLGGGGHFAGVPGIAFACGEFPGLGDRATSRFEIVEQDDALGCAVYRRVGSRLSTAIDIREGISAAPSSDPMGHPTDGST